MKHPLPNLGRPSVPIVEIDGVLLVDTRVIAEQCQIIHASTYRLLKLHIDAIEEYFGTVRFKIEPSRAVGSGGDGQRFALLTEQQASFLVTLTRNTFAVIRFKADLVKAFYEAREKLRQLAAETAWQPNIELASTIYDRIYDGPEPVSLSEVIEYIRFIDSCIDSLTADDPERGYHVNTIKKALENCWIKKARNTSRPSPQRHRNTGRFSKKWSKDAFMAEIKSMTGTRTGEIQRRFYERMKMPRSTFYRYWSYCNSAAQLN